MRGITTSVCVSPCLGVDLIVLPRLEVDSTLPTVKSPLLVLDLPLLGVSIYVYGYILAENLALLPAHSLS